MEREGFLLDVDYITEKGEDGHDRAVIRLWCKSTDGADFVVLDRTFEPYFYALPYSYSPFYGHHDEPELAGKKRLVEEICVYREDEEIGVKRVEFCTRKLLGSTRQSLKIFVAHPSHVPLLREVVRKQGLIVLEADILFAIRYMIDKGLKPFDGLRVEGEEIDSNYAHTADRTAMLASSVSYKQMPGSELPALKTLAFDCEMATQGGHGMPSPRRDPIVIISVAFHEDGEIKSKLFVLSDEDYEAGDDEAVLREFLEFVEEFQPEIIVGYNSDGFDWPYIRERAKLHGIRLNLGADGSAVRYERGKMLPSVNIVGRLNVDLFKLAKRDLGAVKVKTLENVAEFLGVLRKDDRVNLSPREINECWFDTSARESLYEYAKDDAVSTLGIAEKMLPLQIELSKMIGYPLDELAKMGRGRQVEAFLSAEAFKREELVPSKTGGEKTFEGAFVLPPERGLHEDVIDLDFSSMYPTIMISFNVSPDTFVESPGSEDDVYRAPEVGHAFRKTPDGFFKRIMSDLITRRGALKTEMKTHDKNSDAYRVLDIQQQSIKILTNSFYGYTGWSGAKFYKRECAEATTAWGRHFIKRTVQMAEDFGLKVIYGDTDSIFVKLPSELDVEGDRKTELLKKAREASKRISEELPLNLALEDFFKSVFFTGKKKRYAALTDSGEIVVRGLEVRRGDWCELAKEVQTKVIELILKEKDPEKAMRYVKSVLKNLKEGRIPVDKLTIHKTLTRKISSYETKQAHVIAAERALAAHISYEVGSKIPYVIIKGGGKTSDRAFPVDLIERSEGNEIYAEGRKYAIDIAYYIQHQIIPVAHRVLQLFGYDISSFEEGGQKTLGQWF
ncbi:MAG TPA: DNA-directed DNA polymerase [Desulfobacteria bacterium]|nr:DNA-directed DNA polymerase [Desulfobacteria bacterium]